MPILGLPGRLSGDAVETRAKKALTTERRFPPSRGSMYCNLAAYLEVTPLKLGEIWPSSLHVFGKVCRSGLELELPTVSA